MLQCSALLYTSRSWLKCEQAILDRLFQPVQRPNTHRHERGPKPHHSKRSLPFGGMKLIARSASAVMVRLGLTPRFAATTAPSQMYTFL